MPQLSIIVPTFDEALNVAELRRRVEAALPGVDWEMVFVDDDSRDGTADVVRGMAQADPRVRCVHRIGRRGLVSACLEGMLASSAPIVAVIDADLQHDERLLAGMLQALQADPQLDVVVGSRYVEGGGMGDWHPTRAWISRIATRLSTAVLKADLKDPMSGFFMIRHAAALRCIRGGMSGVGFKILLDLFASSPTPLRFRELPYEFRNRVAGESKLGTSVAWEYFIMLLDHFLGGVLPVRFIAFVLVGGFGFLVHMAVLASLYQGIGTSFLVAQGTATLVAMTCNYVLNNVLTYRDMRLRGWKLLTGWLTFTLACSVGALANVGIAEWFFEHKPSYWLLSAGAGVLAGSVWNYAVTSIYTWKKPRTA
ncbi:MAG: glycosyltransferase family 2 protein [Pseudomonadota bacterium]